MSARLTEQQRRDRATTGGDLQSMVVQLARVYGYQWGHFRAAQTKRGWRVPVEGPLADGWPDLMLCRPGRFLLVELKRELGDAPSEAQERCHAALRAAGVEVHVLRPSGFDEFAELIAKRGEQAS